MTRVAVVIGSASPPSGAGETTLPMSDRGAIALALARFAGEVRAYVADAEAGCFARAAGVEGIEALSSLTMGEVDVALIGRGGCAERGDLLPAELAEEGSAALVYEVVDLQREPDRLLVTRDLGRGARDLVGVRGRAVLVVSEAVERGAYVSRHRIEAARQACRGLPEEGAPSRIEWEHAAPRVRLGDRATRLAGSASTRRNALFGMGERVEKTATLISGSAEECARHLLRYLSHHEFVESGLGGTWEGDAVEPARPRPARRPRAQRETDPEAVAARVRRRPRALHQLLPTTRGPFEIGVDV